MVRVQPGRGAPAAQVIGDHIRAVVYLLSDGVLPSNVGRGYIVRRLLRRVIVKVALPRSSPSAAERVRIKSHTADLDGVCTLALRLNAARRVRIHCAEPVTMAIIVFSPISARPP